MVCDRDEFGPGKPESCAKTLIQSNDSTFVATRLHNAVADFRTGTEGSLSATKSMQEKSFKRALQAASEEPELF